MPDDLYSSGGGIAKLMISHDISKQGGILSYKSFQTFDFDIYTRVAIYFLDFHALSYAAFLTTGHETVYI